jgi:hypothetical protein
MPAGMARRRRPNGRHKPRTPVNLVYRTIRATGGPTAVARLLGVSLPTLARWRRAGRVSDAAAVLEWAGALAPDPAAAYRLARRLAGLPAKRRATSA